MSNKPWDLMRSFSRVRISPKEQLSLSSPVAFDRKAWRDEPGLKRYIVSNSRDIPERSITQEHRSAEEQDYCRLRWGPCNSLGALARLSLPPSACQAARARTGSLKAAWGCDRGSSWHSGQGPGWHNRAQPRPGSRVRAQHIREHGHSP